MQRIIFTLAILSLIFSTYEARAEKAELVTFVMPAFNGYVLSIDLPATSTTGKWQRSINPKEWGYEIQLQSRSSKLNLTFRVASKTQKLENIINYQNSYMGKYFRIYETGFNNALGQRSFFYSYSPKKFSRDGKKIKATRPSRKTYYSVFYNRANIKLGISEYPQQDPSFSLTKFLPVFERIAKSIKVTPASEMAPEQLSQNFNSPDILLSRRRDYYLNASLTTTLSPGWAARVVTAEPAPGPAGQGKMVIEVTPIKKLPPDRYEKLTLVLQGIPISKTSSLAGFLDTAKAHLASALPNAKTIRTSKSVILPGAPRFCYMNRKVQGGVSTGKIYVSTYAGKDRDGEDRKVRIYTAGGFTMACNIIYTADPKSFNASPERIGAILNSMKIEVESPEKTELETVVMPAIKGYVLSIDLPKTGTAENWQRSINPDKRGVTIYFNSPSASSTLYFNVWDKPRNFDEYARSRQQNARKYSKVYEDGFNKALGNRTFFFINSPKTISVDGKKVEATKPTNKTYIALFDNRIVVELVIYVGDSQVPPFALPESLPLFERIARSVKVTPASAMGAGQLSQYFSSPKIQISRRRDYYLKATATMALPPGWAAQVVTADPASRSRESGRVVVELTPRRKPLADRYEKLRLVLEGVEIRNVFSLPGFLDTARVYLAAELPNPEKIKTPKTVAMPVSNDGSGYCNMWRKVRRGVSTDKVYVSTYAGKDTNGQDRKVRIYTAGGLTLACNIIYTADPKTFEASQERIGAILKSVKIMIDSPLMAGR